jgi:separase
LDSHMASRLMSRISMLSHTTAPGSPMPWSQPPANVNGRCCPNRQYWIDH